MEQKLIRDTPSPFQALKTLLRADFTVQWRQRRALLMSFIVPIIFLVSWKSLIHLLGGDGVLAICIAIGLPAMGLMGYSMSLARDRERGVFQRLRAAPIPTSAIMGSRLLVQTAMILIMTLVTYFVGLEVDHIALGVPEILLVLVAAVIGGFSFLAIGQTLVAFIKSSDAVNSAARLIYFPLGVLGAIAQIGLFGQTVADIVNWSPLGTTKTMLLAAMMPSTIDLHTFWALLATLGYGIVFAAIGIRYFRWSVQ